MCYGEKLPKQQTNKKIKNKTNKNKSHTHTHTHTHTVIDCKCIRVFHCHSSLHRSSHNEQQYYTNKQTNEQKKSAKANDQRAKLKNRKQKQNKFELFVSQLSEKLCVCVNFFC